MQVAAFIGGADHEHAHVLGDRRVDGRAIVLTDEIPMEVHIIKRAAVDCFLDQRQRAMGGEAHRTHAALRLPAPHHLQTAIGPQRLLEMLRQVEAMDGQQINPLHPKPLKAQAQFGLKGRGIGLGRHLGLQDAAGIGHLGQQPAQLALGAAVVPRGFHMPKSRVHRRLQGGAQVGLALSADLIGRQIIPALLKAHSPQGEHGHRQLRAAEAANRQHQGWARGRVRRGCDGVGSPSGCNS